MVFTDFSDKVVVQAWGLAKLTVAAATKKGDMLHQDGTLSDADASAPKSFDYVALQDGAAAAEINVCKTAMLQVSDTVGTGGAVTQGDHSGSADETLWLSGTAGRAGSAAVAGLAQIVGVALDQQKFILDSTLKRWYNAELVTGAKTLDEQDCGKAMVCTVAATVTLPATSTGLSFRVVNGADDGSALVSISPNSSDLITGPDYAGTDNKDWQNTAATSLSGDEIRVEYKASAGYIVHDLVGVWTQES